MVSSLLLAVLLNIGCINNTQEKAPPSVLNTDTVKRPVNVSPHATLINYGEDYSPVFAWVEHTGQLVVGGKEYPHIQGIRFYYMKAKENDTVYYENLELRNAAKKFNFAGCRVLVSSGESNVHLVNGTDSILMFAVLENKESKRVYRGIEFKSVATIVKNQYGEYTEDVDIEFNIKRGEGGKYTLTLTDGSVIMYQLCATCKESPADLSFLNREDGRIYFINRACYLELLDKDDAPKFQGLR